MGKITEKEMEAKILEKMEAKIKFDALRAEFDHDVVVGDVVVGRKELAEQGEIVISEDENGNSITPIVEGDEEGDHMMFVRNVLNVFHKTSKTQYTNAAFFESKERLLEYKVKLKLGLMYVYSEDVLESNLTDSQRKLIESTYINSEGEEVSKEGFYLRNMDDVAYTVNGERIFRFGYASDQRGLAINSIIYHDNVDEIEDARANFAAKEKAKRDGVNTKAKKKAAVLKGE